MKKSFLNHQKPLFTAMVYEETAEKVIKKMKASIADGCDGFCWQVCSMDAKYHNEQDYRRIIAAAGEKPVYATYYRHNYNQEKTDDALTDGMLELVRAGVTLSDVPGDFYDRTPGEFTVDPIAVEKQKQIIQKLHAMGAEVLMSSHVNEFIPAERVLEIALAHQDRGADIAKIVTGADSMEQQIENLRIVTLLKEKLSIPFLFLSGGESCLLRRIGPMLGCCMWLCEQEEPASGPIVRPVLKNLKKAIENF